MESNLQEQQTSVLEQFRSQVAEFVPEEKLQDDDFLRRWLIARDFNLDKAAFILKNYMQWREENEIDKILEWEPSEDLKKSCPYEISFHDREGRPVLYFPWGSWAPWEFTDTGRRDEYVKYMFQMLEKSQAAIKKPATQFIIFADSQGFAFRHMSKLKAIDANLEVLRQFECRYPEMLGLAVIINCPRVFSLLFSIIRPVMSSRTQDKLEIFDSNSAKWKKRLVHHICRTKLPEKYGGRSDSESSSSGDNENETQQQQDIEVYR